LNVDVVLLTKNSLQPCLEDCLASLKNNVPVNTLIVIDGGSVDGTLDAIRRYEQFFTIKIIVDKAGRAKARQIGIKLVTTEWFLFLDSDVVLGTNWFENARKYMKECVGAIWGAALQRSHTDLARYRAMSRLYFKDELWIAIKAGRRRGLTHDTLIRTKVVKEIEIPSWLHVLEDHFIRQYIESKEFLWLAVSDAYCLHFAHKQSRPRDYYLFGWCGKKIGYLRKRDIMMYFIYGVPKSIWIYLNSRSIQAMKTQLNVYLYTIKGWINS
jgi:glycosyltransferase involved in cell wall biosynthesis